MRGGDGSQRLGHDGGDLVEAELAGVLGLDVGIVGKLAGVRHAGVLQVALDLGIEAGLVVRLLGQDHCLQLVDLVLRRHGLVGDALNRS